MNMFSVVVALFCLLWSFSSRAEEAVWDPVEIAKLSEESAQMSEVVLATVDLLNQVNAVVGTVGRIGAMSTLDFTQFHSSAALAGLAPTIAGSGSQPAAAVRKTAMQDAYALALHIRQSLTEAPVQGRILASSAAASSTMRGDVAADTQAAVAGLNQLIGLHAMLASLLEIRASEQLHAGRVFSSSMSVQQGNRQP